MPEIIAIDQLSAHPDNPRLKPRQDVVDALAARMREDGFDEAHAIIVRPLGDGFQIVSGHHRTEAARSAGLTEVPAWVRDMTDEEAFMALVISNTHSELTPLERGMHALNSGMSVRAYAEKVGRAHRGVDNEVRAARVAEACSYVGTLLSHIVLSEIHAAPRWLWPALVEAASGWTVEATRKAVAAVKEVDEPEAWWNREALASKIVQGTIKPADIKKAQGAVEDVASKLTDTEHTSGDAWRSDFNNRLIQKAPSSRAEVTEIVNAILDEHGETLRQEREAREKEERERRQAEAAQQRAEEQAAERARALFNSCSIEEWKTLDDATKAELLKHDNPSASMNRQKGNEIEWAQWSWNPVTGCSHGCSYCYARDIANQSKMAKFYPHGFEPAFRASTLSAPARTPVPKEAEIDVRYRNVFANSMSDLFGGWMPKEVIEEVIRRMADAPQWNFLTLTKFPKRLRQFTFPGNVWIGTSVDLQARVKAAESAFADVDAKVKWLSVEPMLEPLTFSRLDLFDWIVVGGASRSTATPAFCPPFEWIFDLVTQAREAGVKVYFKTNLMTEEGYSGKKSARLMEMPFDAPVTLDENSNGAPVEFQYLGKSKDSAA